MSDRAVFKPGDFSHGMVNDFLIVFGRQGGNPTLLQRCTEDKAKMERLVRFMERNGWDPITHGDARASGIRIIGPEVAQKLFGIRLARHDLDEYLADIPFSSDTLTKHMSTHFLIFVPAISIKDIMAQQPEHAEQGPGRGFGDEDSFADVPGNAGWHLMRIGMVPDSKRKTAREQLRLLREEERVPSVRVALYAAVAYKLYTGRDLFGDYFEMRCRSNSVGLCHRHIVIRASFRKLEIYDGEVGRRAGERLGIASEITALY